MEKIIHTIVLLLSMFSVKAEYENWMLKFIIEQTDGKKITGELKVRAKKAKAIGDDHSKAGSGKSKDQRGCSELSGRLRILGEVT